MKMKQEHYDFIKNKVKELGKENIIAHKEGLKNDPRVKDLNKRLIWDCLYSAKLSAWICDNLYSYLDDNHINTALKRIMKELELN